MMDNTNMICCRICWGELSNVCILGIDDDQMRAVASAFRENPTQVKELHFSNPQLSAVGAERLVEMLSCHSHALQCLRMVQCDHAGILPAVLFPRLAEAATTISQLQQIWLVHDKVEEHMVPEINTALVKAKKKRRNSAKSQYVEELHLIHCRITDAMAVRLSTGFACLRVLDLRGNKIGDAGIKALAKAIAGDRRSNEKSNLQQICVSENCIGNAGARALAAALGKSASLTYLDLSKNAIESEGFQALLYALTQDGQCLETLRMEWNAGIGDDGMMYLGQALPRIRKLRQLNIGNGRHLSTLVLDSIAYGLAMNLSLHYLNVHNGYHSLRFRCVDPRISLLLAMNRGQGRGGKICFAKWMFTASATLWPWLLIRAAKQERSVHDGLLPLALSRAVNTSMPHWDALYFFVRNRVELFLTSPQPTRSRGRRHRRRRRSWGFTSRRSMGPDSRDRGSAPMTEAGKSSIRRGMEQQIASANPTTAQRLQTRSVRIRKAKRWARIGRRLWNSERAATPPKPSRNHNL